jgi:hypothetical protein
MTGINTCCASAVTGAAALPSKVPSSSQPGKRALTRRNINHQAETSRLFSPYPAQASLFAPLAYLDKAYVPRRTAPLAATPHASFITCSLRCKLDATITELATPNPLCVVESIRSYRRMHPPQLFTTGHLARMTARLNYTDHAVQQVYLWDINGCKCRSIRSCRHKDSIYKTRAKRLSR